MAHVIASQLKPGDVFSWNPRGDVPSSTDIVSSVLIIGVNSDSTWDKLTITSLDITTGANCEVETFNTTPRMLVFLRDNGWEKIASC